jgi:hypothetical protein
MSVHPIGIPVWELSTMALISAEKLPVITHAAAKNLKERDPSLLPFTIN